MRPLRVGETVPPFEAADQEGRVWTADALRGAPFVLFFYPADFTPGCTREAGAFASAWPDFDALGVRVFGVSRDGAEKHAAFAESCGLPYPLLADRRGAMMDAFGARIFGSLPRRITYLVDAQGKVAAVFDSHLRPQAHAEKMMAAARKLAQNK